MVERFCVPSLPLGPTDPWLLNRLNMSMLKRRFTRSLMGKTLNSEASLTKLKGPSRTVFENGFAPDQLPLLDELGLGA